MITGKITGTIPKLDELEKRLEKLEKPKRTEQEILNDFEKLGWYVSKNDNRELIFRRNPEKYTAIWIDKLTKEWLSNAYLGIQEHKLLNELFALWGWV